MPATTRLVTVNPDREQLDAAVVAIRNAYVAIGDRQPLNFDHGERRSTTRVPLRVPVKITGAVIDNGTAKLLDGAIDAELTDLSLRGIAFVHGELFPGFHALVEVTLPGSDRISLLVELVKTEYERSQRSRSAAEFVGIVES